MRICFFFPLALQPPWALASDFQFYDHFTDGRTPWTSDQLVARPLPRHRTTQVQNKHTYQTSMPYVGFEPTIQASKRAKTVHSLVRSATVTGRCEHVVSHIEGSDIWLIKYRAMALYLYLRERKWQKNGENCVMRSFVLYILHQILGRANREDEMWGLWEKWEIIQRFVGKRVGKRRLGRSRSRWADDIKLHRTDSVGLIHPPQNQA
jgi:hypothetical protein